MLTELEGREHPLDPTLPWGRPRLELIRRPGSMEWFSLMKSPTLDPTRPSQSCTTLGITQIPADSLWVLCHGMLAEKKCNPNWNTEDPDYGGFPISVTIPAGAMIAELDVHYLDDEELIQHKESIEMTGAFTETQILCKAKAAGTKHTEGLQLTRYKEERILS
ncbi:hypothetical protein NM208_g10569 [Fusarium decemcellulare]|uniref:Uncharacterized protein n=1 Tax=Fusarium decemcellulare TaxID=57161 RepID=A0ACC1RXK6_9HYPO|nr:hypothetical protein NM208_g10569 [Fusarium decemcellulare]